MSDLELVHVICNILYSGRDLSSDITYLVLVGCEDVSQNYKL